MQVIIDGPRERRADALDLDEFCHTRLEHTLQSAEVLEERTPLRRPEARDSLEDRFAVAAGAAAAMSRDREAVRLVAHALDEAQRGRVRLERSRRGGAVDEEPLLPRPTIRAFRDPDERQIAKPELRENGMHLVDLPESSVDEQQIGRRHFALADAGIAALERLAQRAVIVAGRDAGDVEAAVLLFERPLGAEDHTRGYRALPTRVTDIEAFDPDGTLRQIERLRERGEHLFCALPLGEPHPQGLGRVLLC